VELFIQTQPQRKVQVNVVDTCSDSDCDGCCSRNSGNGAYKLIDIEKHPVAKLLNLDPAGSQFDGGSINYPTAKGLRPGAPESDVMPLCYRIIGQANLTNK
jgi:hypothetical protein